MRACAHTDSIFFPQRVADYRCIGSAKIQCDNRGAQRRIHIAIQFHVRNAANSRQKAPHPCIFARMNGFYAGFKQEIDSRLQASQAMSICRSGLQCRRHVCRMLFVKAVHAAAADQQRCNRQSLSNIYAAGSLRAEQAFVSGKAQHIYAHFLYVNRNGARCLCRIYNEQRARLMCDARNAPNRYDISRHIGCMVHDNRTGIFTHGVLHVLRVNRSVFIRRYNCQKNTVFLFFVQWTQNRIVLANSRHNMISSVQQSVYCHIQRLCDVGCKCNARSIFCMKQLRQLGARAVQHARCFQRRRMRAAARISNRMKRAAHSLLHLFRLIKGCRRTVKIYHGFTSREACVIFSAITYILVTVPTCN